MKKHLVERLMAQANREANELAELLEEAATAIDSLKAERAAAFAMSQCQCGTEEACANLAKLTAERDALKATVLFNGRTAEHWNKVAVSRHNEIRQLEDELATLNKLVREQAEEAYLQKALRRLHAAITGEPK